MRNDIEKRLAALEASRKIADELKERTAQRDITQHIAPVYVPLHEDIQAKRHSIYNLPGGRGSGKSSVASLEIVDGIMKDQTASGICFRRVGATLRESVFAQIEWAIDTLDASDLWTLTTSPMRATYKPTGQAIIFRGLDEATKLKSIRAPGRTYFRYQWYEECCEIQNERTLRNVTQSVQRGGKVFTIFRTFNPPISLNNWMNRLVNVPDDRALTVRTDYTMMPPEWLGEAFIEEAEHLKAVNLDAYRHEYMGEPIGAGGEVFPNVTVRTITDEEIAGMGYFYDGVDFGFTIDPACYIRVSYNRKTEELYLLDEIYKRRLRNSELAELMRGKYKAWSMVMPFTDGAMVAYCDSAEPKSIVDLRANGIDARETYKRPDAVRYRINWLQHRKIIIDPARTPNAYREFTEYEYMTDKDGNITGELPDANNHTIDAVAYSLTPVIWNYAGEAGIDNRPTPARPLE